MLTSGKSYLANEMSAFAPKRASGFVAEPTAFSEPLHYLFQ